MLTLSALLLAPPTASAQSVPLLSAAEATALAGELSGEAAKRTVDALSLHHRTRGSRPFRAAADHIAEQARAFGLDEVRIEEFPADGSIFYGTQRSRPPWDAEFAELWELRDQAGRLVPAVRLASWDAVPMSLAQDSESGEAMAELVDVGDGTADSDYAGKDVRGKLVLVAAQPGAVAHLAVGRHGAAGIVSYAQNQQTAWWGMDDTLIRWGHLETFSPVKTFGFMISLGTARALRDRLVRGERIVMHARVRAGQRPGAYSVATAKISGADPVLAREEIVFSCHLDHPRPGANDNASGCATILEVARALSKLIGDGRIARPARTIRFIWPPEIEGTLAILNAQPEWAARVKAVVHMDMVGGGPETKAIFHVTRGPSSLPSFVYDVGEAIGRFVNEETDRYASTGRADYPLVAPEGGRDALLAEFVPFTMGSDHQVYTDASWGIPAIYMNDWPDRYIHTTGDTPARIDPTKLKRAAFIGGASAYFLARMSTEDVTAVREVVTIAGLRRAAARLERNRRLPADEAANAMRFQLAYEREAIASIHRFTGAPQVSDAAFLSALAQTLGVPADGAVRGSDGEGGTVFRRSAEPRGPMSAFGYDYFQDHYGAERTASLHLPRHQGLWGGGSEYVYEALNLADGSRTVREIRDTLAAIYGPVPLEYVEEYLVALESIGLVRRV